MSVHQQLIAKLHQRSERKEQFGYGLRTADDYVRTITQCVGGECERLYPGQKLTADALIKEASQKLAYSNPDMIVKQVGMEDMPWEMPKNTLMVFDHVLTTPRKDRDGDILRTEGAELDEKMLLLWQHIYTLPIGKMLGVLEHTKNVLRLASAIVDMNELAHDSAVMIENKMGRFSHGFQVLDFSELKDSDGDGMPGGFDITKYSIIEESLVSIPSNPDAETVDILLSLVGQKKLKSMPVTRYAKSIREQQPLSVSVPDMQRKTAVLTLGGLRAEVPIIEEKQSDPCKCHKSPKSDPEGSKMLAYIDGSWEQIERKLADTAADFLRANGVSVDPEDDWVWVVATFSDQAIICLDAKNSESIYYQASWEMDGDEPVWAGEPSEVEIETTVEVAERQVAARNRHIAKRAVQYRSTPVSDKSQWDSDAAVARLRAWAGVDVDGPSDAAWEKYAQGFARVTGDGNKLGDFSFPHHDIEDEKLVVVVPALAAAVAAINGARGGADFESDAERTAVYRHVARHYEDIEDMEAPPLQSQESTVPDTKAGARISRRNQQVISEACDDIREVMDMDVPRAAKSLLRDADKKLSELLDSEEEDETSLGDFDMKAVAAHFVAFAEPEQLRRMAEVVRVQLEIYEGDESAKRYRKLIAS